MNCRKCGTEMRPGKALAQTWKSGLPDFHDGKSGVTMSPGGPGELVDVMKCPGCGHSVQL